MLPRMISYAGNFEDVLLRRAFAGQADGFYLDVGAYDPVDGSVTKHFYDLGWRGINVEPDPAPFARLQDERPEDINLNLALSDREGTLLLYAADCAAHPSVDPNLITGWFGALPEDVREIHLPASTLAAVCETHVPAGRTIDFLKVDVESHEHEVLLGNDWSRWRPRVLVVESSAPERWEPILSTAGYHFALFDGINRVYVRDEDAPHLLDLLRVPVNQADNFEIYGYAYQIAELTRHLEEFRRIGPRALGVARWIQRRAERNPQLAALARTWLSRKAG